MNDDRPTTFTLQQRPFDETLVLRRDDPQPAGSVVYQRVVEILERASCEIVDGAPNRRFVRTRNVEYVFVDGSSHQIERALRRYFDAVTARDVVMIVSDASGERFEEIDSLGFREHAQEHGRRFALVDAQDSFLERVILEGEGPAPKTGATRMSVGTMAKVVAQGLYVVAIGMFVYSTITSQHGTAWTLASLYVIAYGVVLIAAALVRIARPRARRDRTTLEAPHV